MRRTRWIHEHEWPMLKRLLYFVVLASLLAGGAAFYLDRVVVG